jgi:hypothetical protein
VGVEEKVTWGWLVDGLTAKGCLVGIVSTWFAC